MSSFYKAELPSDQSEWDATAIDEDVGSPEEHRDRFWTKGPYGVEMDDDGHFEAYVIVGDRPFKVGDGFSTFQEAVGFLLDSMKEKEVAGDPEEPSEPVAEENTEPRDADEGHKENLGEKETAEHSDSDEEALEEAVDHIETNSGKKDEKTEKSCDGPNDGSVLGPEANSVGKSEDFEKIQHPVEMDQDTGRYRITEDDAQEWMHAEDNAESKLLGDDLNEQQEQRLQNNPEAQNYAQNINAEVQDIPDTSDPAMRDMIDNTDVKGTGMSANEYLGYARENPFMTDPMAKALEGADCNEGTHRTVTPPHPEDVNEKHYIDNRALGSARLLAHAPSLEAFRKSVGGFKDLMAYKNASDGAMYADPVDRPQFMKADESTSFEELDSFEKANHSSIYPESYYTSATEADRHAYETQGPTNVKPRVVLLDPVNPVEAEKMRRGQPYIGIQMQGNRRVYREVDPKAGGKTLYDRQGWGAKRGITSADDYRAERQGQPVSEAEGENITRGPAAQSGWDKREERYTDPEKAKEKADRLLGGPGYDHSFDEKPEKPAKQKKDTTGYGRRNQQPKGTQPNRKGQETPATEPTEKSESFEKRPTVRQKKGPGIDDTYPYAQQLIGGYYKRARDALLREASRGGLSLSAHDIQDIEDQAMDMARAATQKQLYREAVGRIAKPKLDEMNPDQAKAATDELNSNPTKYGRNYVSSTDVLRDAWNQAGNFASMDDRRDKVWTYPDYEDDPHGTTMSELRTPDDQARIDAVKVADAEDEKRRAAMPKPKMDSPKPPEPTPAPAPKPEPKPEPTPEERSRQSFENNPGRPPRNPNKRKQNRHADDPTDPTKKSFREMMEFEKSRSDAERGYPTTMDPGGYPMRDTGPVRELYRNVFIGGYDSSSSPYDPEVHKTDSESRKL